jgi:hypothetical protein
MKHLTAFIFAMSLATHISLSTEPVDANELTLAQFKRMPGVEVFIQRDFISSGWTRVIFELLDHTNYLGVSDYKTKGPSQLTVILVVNNAEKRGLLRAPLHIQRIISGESFSGQVKHNYSQIEFEVESKLLATSYLDFHDQRLRGHTDTNIFFDTESLRK